MLHFLSKHLGLALGMALVLAAPGNAQAQTSEYDAKSAVIFTYFAIGNDDTPSASITLEQFQQQMDELGNGLYKVVPLSKITEALAAKKELPAHTIALTFDGADKSVIDIAYPILKEKNFPFTVFIPSDKISAGKPPFMSWDDLSILKKSKLAEFGFHPSTYSRLTGSSEAELKRQINSAISDIRENLGVNVSLFSYPFGEYDRTYKTILEKSGINAAFGQQSGVVYAGMDPFSLPRFTLTERFGDLERFIMTANALPFPVSDLSPDDPHLTTTTPSIGFTVPDAMTGTLKSLSCFSSTDEKPTIDILDNRVELRLNQPFNVERPRINCTLPVTSPDGDMRWRWLGMLYTISPGLLEQPRNTTTTEETVSD